MRVKTISKLWNTVESKFQREFNVGETVLLVSHNQPIWWSWGVNPNSIRNFGNKCLVFKPNGSKFKGFVCITLGWEDLYHVHFVTDKYVIKKSIEGIYFDELVNILDKEIEC